MTESLKNYRSAIASAWLPLTGRKRLTSNEYALVAEWFDESIPVGVILRAIAAVAERGRTVYSLGVIRADLELLRREQGRLQAGAHKEEIMRDDWREQWEKDLKALAKEYSELTGDCFIFIEKLPTMTEDQARARWKKLTSKVW